MNIEVGVIISTFLAEIARCPCRGYSLQNLRTGELLGACLEGAFTSAARRRGLLGRASFPPGSALVIAPCNCIHTVGMSFPLDVLFVSRAGEVRKLVRGLRPWRAAFAMRAFAVIELPPGTIDRSGTTPGDTLAIKAIAQ